MVVVIQERRKRCFEDRRSGGGRELGDVEDKHHAGDSYGTSARDVAPLRMCQYVQNLELR